MLGRSVQGGRPMSMISNEMPRSSNGAYLLDHKASHTVRNHNNRKLNRWLPNLAGLGIVQLRRTCTYVRATPYKRRTLHRCQQRLPKIMDIQHTLPPLSPVRVISEAMDSDVLEFWISRQPFFGPEKRRIRAFAPCLPRPAPEAVDKHEIDYRFSWG
jgi:hypothetical protein